MIGLPELLVIMVVLALMLWTALRMTACGFILSDGGAIRRQLQWIAIAVLVPVVGPIAYFVKGRRPLRQPGN